MGVSSSNCLRQQNDVKSINGVEDRATSDAAAVQPLRPDAAATTATKMDGDGDRSRFAGTAESSSATANDDPNKRRHSTPSCGVSHLSRLTAGDDVREVRQVRRSGSAAPRRVNRTTKDDFRRITVPRWAEAVRSSRGGDRSTSSQCSSSAVAEREHNEVRTESTTTDASRGIAAAAAAVAVRRRELLQLQSNYSSDGRLGLDPVDSAGGGARPSGVRFESQVGSSDTSSSSSRDHRISASQLQTSGPVRPPQQRRSSIAFLPLSGSSTSSSSSLFSPRSVGPTTAAAAKDRINLGFGNASDLVASLIGGGKSPVPAADTAEDHFWVPSTVWKKKRAQSLVPPKLSSDIKGVSGKSSRYA